MFRKKTLVIFPFLFAIYPVLFLFAHNIEQVAFYETILPAAVSLLFTLLLILLFLSVLGNIKKAAILVSIFLLIFFSYGHIFEIMRNLHIAKFAVGKHRYLMPILGLAFISALFFVARTRRDLNHLTKILNFMSYVLILIPLTNIGIYNLKTRDIRQYLTRISQDKLTNVGDSLKPEVLRDIYYIILDAYPNQVNLKQIFNFDNREFIEYLTKNGFYIASQSQSNYSATFLSLAASLNMKYLNYLTNIVGLASKDRSIAYRMIQDNQVMHFLKSRGYQFIHFSSGIGATNFNRYADMDIHCGLSNEFLLILIRTTIIGIYQFEKYFSWMRTDFRNKTLCSFDRLAQIPKIKGPTFTFAHFLGTHPPYIFGRNGEPVSTELHMGNIAWKQKDDYINQLIFVNKKTMELIDKILSESDVEPIIIIQGDHGTASRFNFPTGGFDAHPTWEMFKERLGILNVYHLPGGGNKYLYDSISPVNTFRLIFNFYFGQHYELLNDESYYSIYEHPYRLLSEDDIINQRF